MATYENKGVLNFKDNDGNLHKIYPRTKSEQVEGLDEKVAEKVVATDPKAHAATHKTGGSDAIKPADIGAIASSDEGKENGVATLGADGKLTGTQVPMQQIMAVTNAAEYSAAASYAVGAYCTKDGKLYRCTTAITEAEAWMTAHWTETSVAAELIKINTLLANKADLGENGKVPAEQVDAYSKADSLSASTRTALNLAETATPDAALAEIARQLSESSGVSIDLLWENASPTSDYSGQAIDISDMYNYPRILAVCRHSTSNEKLFFKEFYTDVSVENMCAIFETYEFNGSYGGNTSMYYRYTRRCKVSTNQVIFESTNLWRICGYDQGKSFFSESNGFLIPTAIYGIH